MIVDAHNHIWDVPWGHLAPDVNAGNADRFLHHMDENGVQYAVVVCHLDQYDPENNERALRRAGELPDRFKILVNVHLHQGDAVDKLKPYLGATELAGVSYYMSFHPDDQGEWMQPGPLFDAIAGHGLAVNLSLRPEAHPHLRELARAYPETPFLICHLGGPRRREDQSVVESPQWAAQVLRSSECPNIYMKISGFAYYSSKTWEYPYRDVLPYIERLARHYTASRMLWGSDYPPTMRYMTYRQSLEVVRTHCTFLSEEEREMVLGGNARRLFGL